jgi:hypothetical protein
VLDVFQPAGNMEEFFRKLGEPPKDLITAKQVVDKSYAEVASEVIAEAVSSSWNGFVGAGLCRIALG